MTPLFFSLFAALAFQSAVTQKPAQTVEAPPKVTLLSSHQTTALFSGIHFQPCRHLTALCPDKCQHAGDVAAFKILEYQNYSKPGKYGDPKTEFFQIMIQDQLGGSKIDKEMFTQIKKLKKGDSVSLSWDHNYVTNQGSSYPVRTITKLEVKNSKE